MSELVISRALPDDAVEPVGDGWTLEGRAVPYNVDQRVSDDGGRTWYTERFAHGAFTRDTQAGGRWVNLFVGHAGDEGARYLGRCIALNEQADGLYASFRINRDHPMAEAARSGELRGWSVSARVYRTRADGPALIREACGLSHVAATASPQYAGAGVLVAREHEVVGLVTTPRADAARKALEALRNLTGRA